MTSVAPETPAPGGTTVGTAGHSQAEGLPSVSSGDSRVAESEASSTAVSARSEDGTGDGEGVGKAKEESEVTVINNRYVLTWYLYYTHHN